MGGMTIALELVAPPWDMLQMPLELSALLWEITQLQILMRRPCDWSFQY